MITTRYRVTLTGVSGTAPKDGFIDNKTIEQYMADGSIPTTIEQTTAKERGNRRFSFLQQQMQIEANVYVTDIVATGASATAAPTSFVFTAEIERGDSVLFTRDETNNNMPLTGTDALKRWIARALIEGRTTYGDIYDPTKGTAPGNSTPAARIGTRVVQLQVAALYSNLTDATASITVTAL